MPHLEFLSFSKLITQRLKVEIVHSFRFWFLDGISLFLSIDGFYFTLVCRSDLYYVTQPPKVYLFAKFKISAFQIGIFPHANLKISKTTRTNLNFEKPIRGIRSFFSTKNAFVCPNSHNNYANYHNNLQGIEEGPKISKFLYGVRAISLGKRLFFFFLFFSFFFFFDVFTL